MGVKQDDEVVAVVLLEQLQHQLPLLGARARQADEVPARFIISIRNSSFLIHNSLFVNTKFIIFYSQRVLDEPLVLQESSFLVQNSSF